VLSNALGAWASFVTVWGAYIGFVTLARGGSRDEVLAQSHLAAIATVPTGGLLAVAVALIEVAT
jgi:hypothetical protein